MKENKTPKTYAAKIIPLTAGTITISNFLFSIIPVVSVSDNIKEVISTSISAEFRFIVFFLFTILFAYTIVKLVTLIDRQEAMPSSKIILCSVLFACYAWIVVFNIKIVALGNSLEGWNYIVFLISSFLFSIYLSITLHLDFKALGYQMYSSSDIMMWNVVDKGFCTPPYVRTLRFLIYWFVLVLGGLFYQF